MRMNAGYSIFRMVRYWKDEEKLDLNQFWSSDRQGTRPRQINEIYYYEPKMGEPPPTKTTIKRNDFIYAF